MEHGLTKVTLSDVGERLGVSKSAIYHYFTNKQHMLRALMRRHMDRLQARLERAAEHAPDPPRKLEAILRARFEYLGRQGPGGWSLETLLSIAPLAQELLPIIHEVQRDLLAGVLRQGCARGDFDIEDVESMADILASTLHSVDEILYLTGRQTRRRKNQEALIQLWLRGLLAR
ncbi:MAG: TetR/AcrR family transcriptional regulator [Deltaproteobacteria bacterium]|nr:TetR/AcrR family transcriptional regulator [Deltaproteobacteria bacterium]